MKGSLNVQIKAVIFDLDNTLVDRKNAFKKYTEQFIDEFVIITESTNRADITEYIRVADQDGYRKKRELYEELMMNLTMKNDVTVDKLLDYWFSEFFKCTVLMDGAIDLLKELKLRQVKLGLITNGSIQSQNAKIDQVRIREYFDDVIVSDEVQLKKPDKRIFEMAIERLGVEPESSLYIGDHPVNDIKGATNAGLSAVWYKGFMEWDKTIEEPKYIINGLSDLIKILEGNS